MSRLPHVATCALALAALAGCSSPPSLADIPTDCDLPQNAWISDSSGITVITEGVKPATEDQVQCILDGAGTSQELQNSVWVNAGPYTDNRKTEIENGLYYSWEWSSETKLHLLVAPEDKYLP